MNISAINPIRTTAPISKTAKTAKVSRHAATENDAAVRDATTQPNDDASAAPKSPVAMSSSAVQAALLDLKRG